MNATLSHKQEYKNGGSVMDKFSAVNTLWVLLGAALVFFMQAGFAMVEAGLTRAKNVAHTMAMNFMIYPLGMIGFLSNSQG